MKMYCLRRLRFVAAFTCASVLAVFLYHIRHVPHVISGIRALDGYDVIDDVHLHSTQTVYIVDDWRNRSLYDSKVGVCTSKISELNVDFDNMDDHILINDYKLKMDYLPGWFQRKDIMKIVDDLGTKKHRASTKIPFFVKPRPQYSGSSWANFRRNVKQGSLYDPSDQQGFAAVMNDMATLPIVAIKENTDSEYLSFNVQFEDGGWALMIPKTMQDDTQDDFAANILAFQLDWALGFHRVPPTVGRYLNIKTELEPLMPADFRQTIYKRKDGRVCFYGTCAGCSRERTSCCGSPGNIEVSLALALPNNTHSVVIDNVEREVAELIKISNPWMKTMESGRSMSSWVSEEFVCTRANIQHELGHTLPLEILDAMYFDMLIDNYVRYNYILYSHTSTQLIPLLLEQGSAFKDTCEDRAVDDFLYRRGGCCLMKKSTFAKLLKLFLAPHGLRLSNYLVFSLRRREFTGPSLSRDNVVALDRRLNKTIAFIVDCLKKHEFEEVIIDDMV